MTFLTMRPALPAAVLAMVAVTSSCASTPGDGPSRGAESRSPDVAVVSSTTDRAFSALEEAHDTRVGVFVVDTGSGSKVSWRSEERFAFASTIKAPLAGAVLDRVPSEDLSRVVRFGAEDLVPYSPVTEQRVETGMPLLDVIDAALRYSDNTAANLLFEEIGGPEGLDRALERLGDRATESVRIEPGLNSAVPGEVRDTTTPRAIARTVGAYVLGDVLPPNDRDLLKTLMIGNTTGDDLIRAGVPDGWVVADKTGSADFGVRNDVAVAFPPRRAPVLIAVMTSRDDVDAPSDDAVVASATRIAVDALG